MRERSATDGKRGRRLKYWEHHQTNEASHVSTCESRIRPRRNLKKIGRSIAGGGRLRGSFTGDKTGRV